LFANVNLGHIAKPSYKDLPALAIDKPADQQLTPADRPPDFSDEGKETLEERLRDLGYL
jgi:hypothetical protein